MGCQYCNNAPHTVLKVRYDMTDGYAAKLVDTPAAKLYSVVVLASKCSVYNDLPKLEPHKMFF